MVNNDRDKAAEQLNIFKEAATKVGQSYWFFFCLRMISYSMPKHS